MAHIQKIWVGCCGSIGELPTSFQVSLTYEEQLLLFNKKLNEIIEVVNQFDLETIQNMIDDAINTLQNYVDNQDQKLYNYIDEQILKANEYTDSQITISQNYLIQMLNEKVNLIYQYINTQDSLILDELQKAYDELDQKINDITFDKLELIDPTTGSLNTIQNVINNIYNYLRYNALTALEFDSIGLTASEFDGFGITALDFDLNAKQLLKNDPRFYMFNPLNGQYELISKVVQDLANLHKENPINALEFDDLELTATEFDAKEITSYNFDFNAKTLLASA